MLARRVATRALCWRRRVAAAGLSTSVSSRRRPDADLTRLAAAMQAFHARHQHFAVPYHFQIPDDASDAASDPWPAELRGMRLSTAIRRFVRVSSASKGSSKLELERVRRELDAVGFPRITDWKRFQWETVTLAALQTFKDAKGHALVPRKFVVPSGDASWPRAAWGLRLGAQTARLRHKQASLPPYQLEDLEHVGFVWDVAEFKWSGLFLPALRRFRELHGHANAPQAFVVPSGSNVVDENGRQLPNPWPKELHGFLLGSVINHVRSSESYQTHVERDGAELARLGFSFSAYDTAWSDKVLPALAMFRAVFGHCRIEPYFVVPHAEPWPDMTRGMRLGFVAQNIRGRGDYIDQVIRDSDTLERLGFNWSLTEAKWRCVVLPSLSTFVQLFKHTDVPREFVVPAAEEWPEQTWGFRLGEFVALPARRVRFADYIEIDNWRLEALGFDSWARGGVVDQDDRDNGDGRDSDSDSDSSSGSDSDSDSDSDDGNSS